MGTGSVVSMKLLTIANFHTTFTATSTNSGCRTRSGCCCSSSSAGKLNMGTRRGFLGSLGSLIAGGVLGWRHGGIGSGGAGAAAEARPEVGLRDGRLRGCDGSAPCVSTSAFQSPSRFMPPWTYLGTQEDAYVDLKRALLRMGAKVVKEDGRRYLYAVLPSPNSKDDVDDLEFLFSVSGDMRNCTDPRVLALVPASNSHKEHPPVQGTAVCYRSVSRVTIPEPPFCWWPGCINGPRNRGRLERLRDDLGWVPLETDEDKRWVPLLLH